MITSGVMFTPPVLLSSIGVPPPGDFPQLHILQGCHWQHNDDEDEYLRSQSMNDQTRVSVRKTRASDNNNMSKTDEAYNQNYVVKLAKLMKL